MWKSFWLACSKVEFGKLLGLFRAWWLFTTLVRWFVEWFRIGAKLLWLVTRRMPIISSAVSCRSATAAVRRETMSWKSRRVRARELKPISSKPSCEELFRWRTCSSKATFDFSRETLVTFVEREEPATRIVRRPGSKGSFRSSFSKVKMSDGDSWRPLTFDIEFIVATELLYVRSGQPRPSLRRRSINEYRARGAIGFRWTMASSISFSE